MTDLSEFLLARIAEDEAVATAATAGPWAWDGDEMVSQTVTWVSIYGGRYPTNVIKNPNEEWWEEEIEQPDRDHIARWDPARVLAECEAKRRIVTAYRGGTDAYPSPIAYMDDDATRALEWTLRVLALPYADHAGYDQEWRP